MVVPVKSTVTPASSRERSTPIYESSIPESVRAWEGLKNAAAADAEATRRVRKEPVYAGFQPVQEEPDPHASDILALGLSRRKFNNLTFEDITEKKKEIEAELHPDPESAYPRTKIERALSPTLNHTARRRQLKIEREKLRLQHELGVPLGSDEPHTVIDDQLTTFTKKMDSKTVAREVRSEVRKARKLLYNIM
ncbi:hypothetical protein N0V88_001111 [Collariella sp. IMI 366227]|nr:hypothetical protein N0V88_001111 [Collariella sp. IMI 366227]